MKTCTKCRQTKPLVDFHKQKAAKDGHAYYCKDCYRIIDRQYRRQNRGRLDRQKQKWRREHEAQALAINRRCNLRRYGLTLARYKRMLAEQGGVCAACGQAETRIIQGTLANLSVDHDHKTGVVRGLLCQACNLLLGLARDDSERLLTAVAYLKRYTGASNEA